MAPDIVLATPDQLDEIVELFDKFLTNGRGFIPRGIIQNLINKKRYVYVLEEKNKIVAVAIGRPGGTLWNLLVHPDFRRKGLGTAIVKFLNPRKIRVKWTGFKNSETEDPTGFFEKFGYRSVEYDVPRNAWAGGKYQKSGSKETIEVMRKLYQISIPQTEIVPLGQLKTDQNNPNRMTKQQLERLLESIKRWGFIVPVVTNQDLLIADGEQRLTVAKMLGMTEVPVIRLPVEDVDRRLLRQVLNKLKGEHELVADALEFEKIIQAGHEQDLKYLIDLSDSQLERYLSEIHEPNPEDYEVPEIDKIKTDIQRGDIYQVGYHRLMCGDATNKQDFSQLMNSELAQIIFTDPLYNVDFEDKVEHQKIENDNISDAEFENLLTQAFQNAYTYSVQRLAFYCFFASVNIKAFLKATELSNWKIGTWIIWVKDCGSRQLTHAYRWQFEPILYLHKKDLPPFYAVIGSKTNVWQYPSLTSFASKNDDGTKRTQLNREFIHPNRTPIDLIKEALMNSSQPNEITLDMFGGSGSTLIACEQTNRICYMMEIDPRYCEVICQRWEKYTGKQRVKTEKN